MAICPTAEAEEAWCTHVREQAEQSLLPYARSWYDGSNIPGKVRAYVFHFAHFGR